MRRMPHKETKAKVPAVGYDTAEQTVRMPTDLLLRKYGFQIESRPVKDGKQLGPNLWRHRTWGVMQENEALAYVAREKMQAKAEPPPASESGSEAGS